MKNFTRTQFERLADTGTLRNFPSKNSAEMICETPFEHGINNGHSLSDICYFYAVGCGYKKNNNGSPTKKEIMDAAYALFVLHAAHFGRLFIGINHVITSTVPITVSMDGKALRRHVTP